jgi:peptidoglycan/LPS O-acetylase OafA/YrhL
MLRRRVLRSVGNISFSLYLYHYFVVRSMSSVDFIPLWLRGVVALLISIGIAMISYLVVEKPALRFGARIAQRAESLSLGKRVGA